MTRNRTFEERRADMVDRQLRSRGIRDERVLAAMARVPREAFVPAALADHAYDDAALPIGEDQTISQPYIVAAMCELLALDGDEHVLDVGTGSGYAAGVLDELAGAVVSIERVPALAERARRALADTGHGQVEVLEGDGSLGAPERAPFDAIAVAAATATVPPALYAQLVEGGRMVLPVGGSRGQHLTRVVRAAVGPEETGFLGCRFVPLVQGSPGRKLSD
jgi:protein-L-isoaspartate(D-aspartate) O-methyltransferase